MHEPGVCFWRPRRSNVRCLGDTFGSPLVHFGGQLLNGSPSICPNASPQPSFASVIYGPWCTTFATSLILNSPILPMHGTLLPRRHANSSQTQPFGNASTLGPKANDHALWTSDKSLRFWITPMIEMFSRSPQTPFINAQLHCVATCLL
ncbi:hypothetical protein TNCV_2889841 [Trichonephila clavipes]|nr:hypothetical protein TNCV_2889841 [Trichonephila clavipes]